MREKAFELWKASKGERPLRDIAKELGVTPQRLSNWKRKDNWDERLEKVKGYMGNKNAAGNKGGTGVDPETNERHGLVRRYLPREILALVDELEGEDKIIRLRRQIAMHEAVIIRSHRIMYVKDQEDLVKYLKKETAHGREWEFQYPWDRQERFLIALSKALNSLCQMYKVLDELTPGGEEAHQAMDKFVEALSSNTRDVWGESEDDEEED